MFSELGFLDASARPRRRGERGAGRRSPSQSYSTRCAPWAPRRAWPRREQAYHQAGADLVAIVPSTARGPRRAGGGGQDAAVQPILAGLNATFSKASLQNYNPRARVHRDDCEPQCRLAARPVGLPKPTDSTVAEEPVPSPAEQSTPP